ncbi:MAG TPA: hypothetical protein VMU84_06010, partial [Thermoanaerobaculia bacterium]|nr:hypothetical protein [Thermoanaerobaculia bacterium]
LRDRFQRRRGDPRVAEHQLRDTSRVFVSRRCLNDLASDGGQRESIARQIFDAASRRVQRRPSKSAREPRFDVASGWRAEDEAMQRLDLARPER